MKFLQVLGFVLLCSIASAAFYEDLTDSQHEMEHLFIEGLENVPSLKAVIGDGLYSSEFDKIETDVKSELGKAFREALSKVLDGLQDKIKKGQEILQQVISKAKEIIERIQQLTPNGNAKQIVERFREKAQDVINTLLEKFGFNAENFQLQLDEAAQQIDLHHIKALITENILNKVDISEIIKYVTTVFGEFSETSKIIVDAIKKNGLAGVKDLIASLMSSLSDYGWNDFWRKAGEFFGGLGKNIGKKFQEFGRWVGETTSAGLRNVKSFGEKIKVVAQNVINNVTTMSKAAAQQAWEYLKEHKAEIGEALFKKLTSVLLTYIGTIAIG